MNRTNIIIDGFSLRFSHIYSKEIWNFGNNYSNENACSSSYKRVDDFHSLPYRQPGLDWIENWAELFSHWIDFILTFLIELFYLGFFDLLGWRSKRSKLKILFVCTEKNNTVAPLYGSNVWVRSKFKDGDFCILFPSPPLPILTQGNVGLSSTTHCRSKMTTPEYNRIAY